MKYAYECQKCKSKEVYKPRKELPKDPHTKCSQCGQENHFKDGDLEALNSGDSRNKIIKKSKPLGVSDPPTTFIDDPDELLLSVSMRELNKPDPDPRWGNLLIAVRKENIGISKKEGKIRSKFKSMNIKDIAMILSTKQKDTSPKPDLKESS